MSMTDKSRFVEVQWDGESQYTLTASYVASDEIPVDFVKMGTLYAVYDAGATTRTLDYVVEFNPYPVSQNANTLEPITYDAYWSPVGIYVNTTGNWAEQSAAYHSIAAATTNPTAVTPLVIPQIDAARMRIRAKESATGGGTVNFVFVKNTIN